MRWWICDGEVVGAAGSEEETPANFERVEGVETGDRDLVYFDGETVILKPQKPSPDAVWSVGDRAWIVPAIVPVESIQDFAGLEARFRNSAVWFRVWSSAGKTLRANVAFTVLFAAMTTHHSFEDVRFSFNEMRAAMQEQSTLTDFTAEELEFVRKALIDNGFETTGFNLSLP